MRTKEAITRDLVTEALKRCITPGVDAHQSGRLALFGQPFAPIHNSTLGFELMAAMARMLCWHGLLEPLARN